MKGAAHVSPIIPDRIADLIAQTIPDHVREAVTIAADARRAFLAATPADPATRRKALQDLAAANKVLASYNPGLTARLGGAR